MRLPGATIASGTAAGICLVLAGCATRAPSPVANPIVAASPAPVAGYDWFYHSDAQQASLAYGLKDSDELRVGLECSRGDGKLELSAVAPTGTREIRLESGGDMETFRAEGEPSQLHEGDFLTAESKTDAPVFQRFRRVGWMAQWQGERREMYAAHATAAPDIERFFAFCG